MYFVAEITYITCLYYYNILHFLNRYIVSSSEYQKLICEHWGWELLINTAYSCTLMQYEIGMDVINTVFPCWQYQCRLGLKRACFLLSLGFSKPVSVSAWSWQLNQVNKSCQTIFICAGHNKKTHQLLFCSRHMHLYALFVAVLPMFFFSNIVCNFFCLYFCHVHNDHTVHVDGLVLYVELLRPIL